MKIGIIGTGNIGSSLVLSLSRAGHEVRVANSRGPETIDKDLLVAGAAPMTAEQAVEDIDALILSIPMQALPSLAQLIASMPETTTIIDTSNYYPARDNRIEAIEDGQVESLWVVEQLGRPIAKAWNAIGSGSLATRGMPPTASGRIAIPVAADRDHDRSIAMTLVENSGFDAFDAGSLAESWRQQPGNPCYGTDLAHSEMKAALATADASRAHKRRDLVVSIFMERYGDGTTNPDANYSVRVARAVFM